MRSAAAILRAVWTTCSIKVMPPARCSTLALLDFILVPSPAARMATVTAVCMSNLSNGFRQNGLEFGTTLAPPAARHGQPDSHVGDLVGIVSHHARLPDEIAGHNLHPDPEHLVNIILHRQGLLA